MTQYERHQLRIARRETERQTHVAKLEVERQVLEEIKAWEKAKETKEKTKTLTEYVEALRLKRFQCLNTWGRLEDDEWRKVKESFIKSVLQPTASFVPLWMNEIDRRVGPLPSNKPVKTTTVDLGAQFEMKIALDLRTLGWNVQLLGKSGDQGGDLLAQKANKSVVIQCKHYSSKVGNDAVQEVIAGRQFYHVAAAAVVASNGFTRQAQALADKAGVFLLAPNQLTILG
jgi:restriction system protein